MGCYQLFGALWRLRTSFSIRDKLTDLVDLNQSDFLYFFTSWDYLEGCQSVLRISIKVQLSQTSLAWWLLGSIHHDVFSVFSKFPQLNQPRTKQKFLLHVLIHCPMPN